MADWLTGDWKSGDWSGASSTHAGGLVNTIRLKSKVGGALVFALLVGAFLTLAAKQ